MKTIYQSFWQISFVFGVILFASGTQAADCTPTPDCGSLGYTQTEADCQGVDVVLKCPYNTKQVACLISSFPVSAILYGDGTVSSEVVAGKTPIGVVFDTKNRLAVALTDVKQDGSAGSERMMWSSEGCDVPNLEKCTDSDTVITTCGIDGRANTDAILATNGGCSGTTYAANAVNSYEPAGCSKNFCKKGKWFLPSLRDLYIIYSRFSEINNTFTVLSSAGAQEPRRADYWSSTEYGWGEFERSSAWRFGMEFGSYFDYYKDSNMNVRPVVKF